MTNELQTTNETGVTAFDPEAVRESQRLSGQTSYNSIPFIPIIEVNNKKEKRTVEIDGVAKEVELEAEKGFIITRRNDKEYTKDFIAGNIAGIILKERFQIDKSGKKGEFQYKSDEFDGWDEVVRVYNKSNRKETVVEGTYKQIKESLTTTNNKGESKKDFDLFAILYINLEGTGEVFRLRVKLTLSNKWFDYKNSFGKDEPWAGYMTHFNLEQETFGDNTFWHFVFERGQQVNLSEQLAIQKEINKYFMIANVIRSGDIQQAPLDAKPVYANEATDLSFMDEPVINQDEEGESIAIEQIPF